MTIHASSAAASAAQWAAADPMGSLCRWAPPAQASPTTYTATGNFQAIAAGPNEDVIVYGKATAAATGALQITGGRHVRIIGGKWAKTTTGASIRVTNATGSVFIEGVEIDASGYNGDAINACGVSSGTLTYPDVYIQNCRVYGLNGTFATNHADIYQPQGPVGRIFIDQLTGSSDYQGIFIPPQDAITKAYLSRINLTKVANAGQPITYPLWLASGSQEPYPVSLDEVYVSLPAGQTLAADGVWPAAGQTSTAASITGQSIGALDDGGGNAYWPSNMQARGKVHAGAPPSGDFVPAGTVGIGYAAKGYLTTAPAVAVTPSSWESEAGFCWTGDASDKAVTSSAWPTANRMIWMRLKGARANPTQYRLYIDTQSGNLRIVTAANTGTGANAAPSGTFTNDTGVVACPAAGIATIAIPTPSAIADGDWLGLVFDNTTAATRKFSSPPDGTMVAGRLRAQSGVTSGVTAPSALFGATQCYYVAVE